MSHDKLVSREVLRSILSLLQDHFQNSRPPPSTIFNNLQPSWRPSPTFFNTIFNLLQDHFQHSRPPQPSSTIFNNLQPSSRPSPPFFKTIFSLHQDHFQHSRPPPSSFFNHLQGLSIDISIWFIHLRAAGWILPCFVAIIFQTPEREEESYDKNLWWKTTLLPRLSAEIYLIV